MGTFLLKLMNVILVASSIIYIVGDAIPFIAAIPMIDTVCEIILASLSFIKAIICFSVKLRKDGIIFLVCSMIFVFILLFKFGVIQLFA